MFKYIKMWIEICAFATYHLLKLGSCFMLNLCVNKS